MCLPSCGVLTIYQCVVYQLITVDQYYNDTLNWGMLYSAPHCSSAILEYFKSTYVATYLYSTINFKMCSQ